MCIRDSSNSFWISRPVSDLLLFIYEPFLDTFPVLSPPSIFVSVVYVSYLPLMLSWAWLIIEKFKHPLADCKCRLDLCLALGRPSDHGQLRPICIRDLFGVAGVRPYHFDLRSPIANKRLLAAAVDVASRKQLNKTLLMSREQSRSHLSSGDSTCKKAGYAVPVPWSVTYPCCECDSEVLGPWGPRSDLETKTSPTQRM